LREKKKEEFGLGGMKIEDDIVNREEMENEIENENENDLENDLENEFDNEEVADEKELEGDEEWE
jgi:hypothetical protein